MNIYQATLAAADHIERNPGNYDFCGAVRSPSSTADKGCLIGWIAYFVGEAADQPCGSQSDDAPLARRLVGVSFAEFEERFTPLVLRNGGSYSDAGPSAAALREYAAKYLAKPQQQPPDWQAMAERLARMSAAELQRTTAGCVGVKTETE